MKAEVLEIEDVKSGVIPDEFDTVGFKPGATRFQKMPETGSWYQSVKKVAEAQVQRK
jgi:hypothetical protein